MDELIGDEVNGSGRCVDSNDCDHAIFILVLPKVDKDEPSTRREGMRWIANNRR